MRNFHSVILDEDKCKGCINCMKRCPTEAIRVRAGRAHIIDEKCIDCGECIRICPNRAKKAQTDPISVMKDARFRYRIALPAPSFYGQFSDLDDTNRILSAFPELGFDEVAEVARAAEVVSDLSRRLLRDESTLERPVINSACPAVLRLISIRFPELLKNVLPVLPPVEIAARDARKKAAERTGLDSSEIGVFFISPCPAKVTGFKNPVGYEKSAVDGAFSASEIYKDILLRMKAGIEPRELRESGIVGLSWASSGGEATALLKEHYLAADGIENVIGVLEDIEDGKLSDLTYIELNACTGGCVGGVLNVANPFLAKTRLMRLRKYLPLSCNKESEEYSGHLWSAPIGGSGGMKLDEDRNVAFRMYKTADSVRELLGGLDCGTCGAPSCRAFAEDVAKGIADISDCIVNFSKNREAEKKMIPAPFRKAEKDRKD